MATPLDTAVNRMAELREELAELETFVRVYYRMFPGEKLSEKLPSRTRMIHPVNNGDKTVDNSGSSAASTLSPGDQKRMEIADNFKMKRAKEVFGEWFVKLIAEAGKPQTRAELLEQFEAREDSPPIHSDDKLKYLGTLLWRNRATLRNLPGHGYWLKDEPYEPAKYDPATDTDLNALMDHEAAFVEQPYRDPNAVDTYD